MTTKKMTRFKNLLGALIAIDLEFPLLWALVFAEIAMHEGASLREIANRTGISMSVMSRTIGALSNTRRMGKPYGLVVVKPSKEDRRQKELYLSAKGKALAAKIVELL